VDKEINLSFLWGDLKRRRFCNMRIKGKSLASGSERLVRELGRRGEKKNKFPQKKEIQKKGRDASRQSRTGIGLHLTKTQKENS